MSSTRSNPICLRVKFIDDVDIARSLRFVLIANKMAASRFASLTEDDFEDILRHKDAENARKATQVAVTLFRSYLFEKGKDQDFEKLDKTNLASLLSRFYLEARKSNGDFYKTSSLNSIRAGLNRFLKDEYQHGIIDIIKDQEFVNANVSYRAATVQLKKLGKGDVLHHTPLDKNDITTLYESGVFDQSTPSGLQKKVWFELMIYICRRGRENLRNLKRDHFQIYTDSDGREYVVQARDELTKKAREDDRSTRTDGGRMYETRDNDCPVASFKQYISKLNPACDAFFQTPKAVAPSAGPWYKNCPMGTNVLGTMMVHISKIAKLSKVYTNHCLRATCITILDKTGFASREICQVSGHRNEGSLASYIGRVSDDKKHDISNALSRALGKEPNRKRSKTEIEKPSTSTSRSNVRAPATVSKAPVTGPLESGETSKSLADNDNRSNLPFHEEEEEVNFNLDYSCTSSQEIEETHHSQVLSQEAIQDDSHSPAGTTANNTNITVARNSVTAVSTRHTSTTTSRTHNMRFQQSPFVLNNCNVTINYYTN